MGFDLENTFVEFMSECEEITQRISTCLQEIEKGIYPDETIDAIYRDVHTLKGSANLFGFTQMGQLAHAMEACLEPFRKKLAKLSGQTLDILFDGLGALEKLVHAVDASKKEPDFSVELANIIPRLIESTVHTLATDYSFTRDAIPVSDDVSSMLALHEAYTAEITPVSKDIQPRQLPVTPEIKPQEKSGHMESGHDSSENSAQASPSGDPSQTIRVQISRLDKLMNLIGEMVLVRNQVLQFTKYSEDNDFLKLGKRLDLVTTELQGEVMQTRMQPIGTVLDKFQRVVRDLNRELGKKIDLILVGAETEVDKSLLESVKDPLTHLVRNACDHGLENPQDRRAAGKAETGKVTIRSYHEGGQVVIEISDDGRGLSKEKIIKKAIEKNLIKPGDVSKLSDKEIYNIIFAPGFSTSENITTVSGRGVGMDVVRTNIEKIGGVVELATVPQQGSTVRLRIPLTLAIVPAMVVRAGKNRFAIPQVKLVELVRAQMFAENRVPSGDETSRNQIEMLQGKPMFRMRGNLLPLVSLKDVLGLGESNPPEPEDNEKNIVILNGDGIYFGLIVDEIQDTTDIVVKPLTKFLKNLSVYSGATIMGDGTVVLIFDVAGIARRAELGATDKATIDSQKDNSKLKSTDLQEFLLFKAQSTARHAMALCLVQRLEEFDKKAIECAGKQAVVRYRGTILPLISMNQCLAYSPLTEASFPDKVSVIVVQKFGRNFGLVVDEILDVVTSDGVLDDTVKDRPGLLGSLLQGDEVIVVVDPLEIIDREFQKMSANHFGSEAVYLKDAEKEKSRFSKVHILYAEDTAFFRKQVVKSLEKAGIKVTAVQDGKEAFDRLESEPSGHFSLVLSDIEMPVMTGFELASSMRASEKLKLVPMIALTTRFKTADLEEGKRVGFNLYLEKFNSDQVIRGIEDLLKIERKAV